MNSIETVAIIGGGVIGGGWAARLIENGIDVRVFDPAPDAPEKDTKPISGSLQLAIGLATVMTFILGVLPGLADSLGRAAQL